MKKMLSILLAAVMLVSAVPTAFAADYTEGTMVEYIATGTESYTITVPAKLNPGQEGTVTLAGTWADNRVVTVTAEENVTLVNSILASDTKTLKVTFDGISEAGNNTQAQTFTENVSVAGIENALFGIWSGKFNYNVETETTATVTTPLKFGEKYICTTDNANSDQSMLGHYMIGYADGSGAMSEPNSEDIVFPAGSLTYTETEIVSLFIPEGTQLLISADGTTLIHSYNGEVGLIYILESALPANLITFTIDGKQYHAEEGMSLSEWTHSDYNTDGYIMLGVTKLDGTPTMWMFFTEDRERCTMEYSKEIITNAEYTLVDFDTTGYTISSSSMQ